MRDKNKICVPFAASKGFLSSMQIPSNGEELWFIFSGNQLLVNEDKRTLPAHHDFTFLRTIYLGTLDGVIVYAGEVPLGVLPPRGWEWNALRPLYLTLDADKLSVAGYAMQLLYWDRTNKFCGTCGEPTFPRLHERCRECQSCKALAYPKLSPAVLAIVSKGDQILLATNPQFPEPFYSLIAGFVDPGETLEQCVSREVFEEVGLKVKNVRYLGSQPWPFSNSLMIGFSCEWESGEIQANPQEIGEAAWFYLTKLPMLPPVYSLSRILLEEFLNLRT